jgi:hypothetical protein
MRLLAVAVLAAALGSVAAAGNAGPTIRITHRGPMKVTGTHFRPGEKVTVTALGSRMVVRHVVAMKGRFTVTLGPLRWSRCNGLRIVAIGSLGSRAVIRTPLPVCLPVPLPDRTGRAP